MNTGGIKYHRTLTPYRRLYEAYLSNPRRVLGATLIEYAVQEEYGYVETQM